MVKMSIVEAIQKKIRKNDIKSILSKVSGSYRGILDHPEKLTLENLAAMRDKIDRFLEHERNHSPAEGGNEAWINDMMGYRKEIMDEIDWRLSQINAPVAGASSEDF